MDARSEGKILKEAMDAYFKTDRGRKSVESEPCFNPYLRNRVESAFIEGWDAAKRQFAAHSESKP